MPAPLTPEIVDELLLATDLVVSDAADSASSLQDSQRERDRAVARSYIDGETPEGLRNRPNRSTYVDTVVRDALLWVQPSLNRVFHGSERAVEVHPINPEQVLEHRATQAWLDKVLRKSFVTDSQTMFRALSERIGWQRVIDEPDQIGIYNIRPEYVLYPRDALPDRASWPYIGVKTPTTPALLRAEGFDVGDDLRGDELEANLGLDADTRTDLSAIDDSMREVWKYDIWIKQPELGGWLYVVRVGRDILSAEMVDDHDMVFFVMSIRPDQLEGFSLFDLVRKMQDLSTALHRSVNDYVYRLSNPREEVVETGMTRETVGDLMNDTLDGRIRVKAAGTILPIQTPPLPGNVLDLLERYDERTTMRTGVQRAQQGLAPDTLNKTASGQAMIMDASGIRIEDIARTLAETGFSDRTALILRKSAKRPDLLASCTVNLAGQLMQMTPDLLLTEFEVTVNPGVGVGNRVERLQAVRELKDFYAFIVANAPKYAPGSPNALFTSEHLYNAQAEMLRLAGYHNTGAYLVDPTNQMALRDPPDPPPPPTPEEQYVEVERAKLGLQREKDELMALREAVKAEREALMDDVNARAKEAEAELALREAKAATRESEAKAVAAEEKARIDQKRLELDQLEVALKYGVDTGQVATALTQLMQLQEALDAMRAKLEANDAPEQILYDDLGEIIGTQKVVGGKAVRRLLDFDDTGAPVGVAREEADVVEEDDDDQPEPAAAQPEEVMQ